VGGARSESLGSLFAVAVGLWSLEALDEDELEQQAVDGHVPMTIRAVRQVGNSLKWLGPDDPLEPRYANYMRDRRSTRSSW
jgi:hypothetical protein